MSIYKGTTLIAGALPNSANQDLSNLSQTGQAVIDGKADTDLSNATDNGKILMSSMGMPSETYIDLTLGASGSTYTAPANGYYVFRANLTNGYIELTHTRNILNLDSRSPGSISGDVAIFLPVKKNDTIVTYYAGVNSNELRFVYAVGSESEAS